MTRKVTRPGTKAMLAGIAAATVGLLGASRSALAVVTVDSYEGTNFPSTNSNPAEVTYTTSATTGVTNGSFSLGVNVQQPTGWVSLGNEYPNLADLKANNQLKLDITVPLGSGTGNDYVTIIPIIQTSNIGWGQLAGQSASGGSPTTSLTFDYSSLSGSVASSAWCQMFFYAASPDPARTFYIDNLRLDLVSTTPVQAVWQTNGNGNWSEAANWNPGVPIPTDSTATLGTNGGAIVVSPTIAMDVGAAVRTLTFNTPSGQGYVINGTNTLTIHGSATDGSVQVLSGQHVVNAPLAMADNTSPNGGVINVAAGASLTANDFRAQYTGVQKTGDGLLAVNTLDQIGLNVDGGTLRLLNDGVAQGAYTAFVHNAGTVLDLNGKAFTTQYNIGGDVGTTIALGTGGTLKVMTNGGGTSVVNSNITGSGNIILHSQNSLLLQGSASSFVGAFHVDNGGTLQVNNPAALGDPSNTIYLGEAGPGTLIASGPLFGPGHKVTLGGDGGTINTNGFDVTLGAIDPGPLTKSGNGTLSVARLDNLPSVTVSTGTLQISSNGQASGVSRVAALSIAAGAKLDLSDNHLITQQPLGSWNGTQYSDVAGMIASGRSGASWTGSGIITSQAAAQNSNFTTLGVATAGQVKGIADGATAVWGGQTVTGTDTLVMYTYGGDANLDGKINVDDYGHIDSSIPLGVSGWFNGDFNYDGKINVDDYGIIDSNVPIQGAPFFAAGGISAAGGGIGVTAVPEPAALTFLTFAAACGASVRRQRRGPQRTCSL